MSALQRSVGLITSGGTIYGNIDFWIGDRKTEPLTENKPIESKEIYEEKEPLQFGLLPVKPTEEVGYMTECLKEFIKDTDALFVIQAYLRPQFWKEEGLGEAHAQLRWDSGQLTSGMITRYTAPKQRKRKIHTEIKLFPTSCMSSKGRRHYSKFHYPEEITVKLQRPTDLLKLCKQSYDTESEYTYPDEIIVRYMQDGRHQVYLEGRLEDLRAELLEIEKFAHKIKLL